MRRRRYRRRGRGARWLVVCALVVLALAAVITLRFRPVFMEYAVNLCEDSALQEINNVLQDKIYADRETYENLVVLERDDENHVTALKTDVIAIGQIKAALVNGLFERLEDLEQTTVEVPLGSVFAPSLFSGMGPTVDVGMTALSQMSAEFVSAFSSAGINQTRHNILIEVRAGFRILTPFGVTYKEVKTSYPVTDTVIIGTVPEQYTYIDDTRDGLLGKINDYAETN
ncbi:sporulation protein YunB [Butyricicoccus faecihominis]|uniref:sporulation protein YunB n=1 Tax=Butyricicoccaceae TaxID=3085642 RepID=UPI002478759D|nr:MULTISPECIES: sporulation protein YunB [Butyricicoccaceae]MCQ5128534.1 sporulation protein YunB [Butyricicoccus faecihominis]WNX83372.1 sporulation protein YunB [Agathobaculum sp. NTUH-O15-33]